MKPLENCNHFYERKINRKCIKQSNDSKIVCHENRIKITFINPDKKTVKKIKIDGCQTDNTNQRKCDFLVLFESQEHFIELKASRIEHALTQLNNSISELSCSHIDVKKRFSYIVVKKALPMVKFQSLLLKSKLKNVKQIKSGNDIELKADTLNRETIS